MSYEEFSDVDTSHEHLCSDDGKAKVSSNQPYSPFTTNIQLLYFKHHVWKATLRDATGLYATQAQLTIDNSSPFVLIQASLADELHLPHTELNEPFCATAALSDTGCMYFTHTVTLHLLSHCDTFATKSVTTFIAPVLAHPMLLGRPFLVHNNLIDAGELNTICGNSGWDLLNCNYTPILNVSLQKCFHGVLCPIHKHTELYRNTIHLRSLVMTELAIKIHLHFHKLEQNRMYSKDFTVNIVKKHCTKD